jgi:hypothetical protein
VPGAEVLLCIRGNVTFAEFAFDDVVLEGKTVTLAVIEADAWKAKVLVHSIERKKNSTKKIIDFIRPSIQTQKLKGFLHLA